MISKISKLQEGETLILPDTYFSVNYLHIKQNWTIKGKESTTMSVLGKILIGNFDENISDESEQSNLSEKVQVFFSEIYIKFNPIIRIQSQQFSRKSTWNAWEEEQTFPAYYLFENSSAGDMRKDESLTSLMVSLQRNGFKEAILFPNKNILNSVCYKLSLFYFYLFHINLMK